jgi:tetratricopeptide (TPR) repeat protein
VILTEKQFFLNSILTCRVMIVIRAHTIFRIEEIDQMDNGIWHIHLTMTNKDDEQLRELTDYFQKDLHCGGLYSLFLLMMNMGEYSRGHKICQTMLAETPTNDHVQMADIHSKIGWCCLVNNNLDTAQKHFEIAIDFAIPNYPFMGVLLYRLDLGYVFYLQGKYDLALQQSKWFIENDFDMIMSLEIGHDMFAKAFSFVGLLLLDMCNYQKALEMSEKALKLHRRSGMPTMHPSIVSVYNNIGLCHMHMRNFESALPYLRKTIEFYKRALPANHPSIAVAHNNIARCLKFLIVYRQNIELFFELIEHARLALDIAQKSPALNSCLVYYQDLWDETQIDIQLMEGKIDLETASRIRRSKTNTFQSKK